MAHAIGAASEGSDAHASTTADRAELMEEAKLFAAARQGSVEALDQLLKRLASQLWEDLQGRPRPRGLGPSAGLSDIAQDTLLAAQQHFAKFQRCSFADFHQWARKIFFRRLQERARNHRHRNREEVKRFFAFALQARLGGDEQRLDQAAELHEEAERAYRLYQSLALHERSILQMRVLEGLPYARIAAATGITPDAARAKFRRALARLKDRYDAHA